MSRTPEGRTPVHGLRFHHVGVAVKSLDAAVAYYTGLFGLSQVTAPIEVPGERVRVCFLEAPPGVLIELVEGLGESSPVADVVARTGAGPYHLCYLVADLDAAIRKLRAGGCRRLKRFTRPGAGDPAVIGSPRRFAFLLTPDRQLFELCEADRGPADRGPADRGPADRGPAERGPAELVEERP